ncbi:MAG: hypothetical protein IJ482_04680 [Alphaproteobacteria bacterium]|nr:hypothetical protein [Alphaproteobacteria bacterium]
MNSTKLAALALKIALPCLLCFSYLVMTNMVQELESELNSINRGIEKDIKSIHVLKAEWSHLNNPSRLRKLVSKHILLNQVQAEQIINYSALPFSYEDGESRKIAARKNISNYAEHNKGLKKLTKAQR